MRDSLPELLSNENYSQYRSKCHQHLKQPPKEFIPNLIGNYCIQGLIIQAHFHYKNQAIFEFGLNLLPKEYLIPDTSYDAIQTIKNRESPDLPPGLSMIHRWFYYEDQVLDMCIITLKPLRRICANLIDYELYPIVESWYFNQPPLQQDNTLNQAAVLHRIFSDIIPPVLGTGVPVTISHFHFQELKIYLEVTGEQQSRDFFHELMKVFKKNLKQSDLVFQLTPVSYIVISPGATRRIMTDRFKHIFFMIKSLVLEYKLNIITIQKLPVVMNDIWKELNI